MAGVVGSVRPSARPAAPGLVRRKSLIGFRLACQQMWGEAGYEAICHALPADVNDRTGGTRPLPEQIFLDDLIAWHLTVWNGPAQRDEQIMTQHIRATVDQGFGRVKRFLISTSTPQMLAARVVSLWRDEYSTGRLEATSIEERSVHLALLDHAYLETPLMRYVIAEVFRYIVSLTRAKAVTVSHALRGDALVIVLRWV